MIGKVVSHYRILEHLGTGGMGEVFRAEDVNLGRSVALKFLRPELLNESKARQRFEFEARTAGILNHPHITTLYEFNAGEGYLSFEYIQGSDFEHRLAGAIPPLESVKIGLAVCRALGHAHGRSVVHRDIKPSNVLLGNDGAIKLTDFGLARMRDAMVQATQEIVAGTPAYMAPERISGHGSDHRGDLFSLGVLLYRALAGRLPWNGEGVVEILFSVLQQEPEPLDRVTPDLPPALVEVTRRLMEKEPDDRLATAAEAETLLLEAEAWLTSGPPAVVTIAAAPAAAPAAAEAPSPAPAPTAFEFPLVGRAVELGRLETALRAAIDGQGSTLLLRGQAGMGKSRLIQELESRWRDQRVLFLRGRCLQHGGRNFGPLVDALEGFARGVTGGGERYMAHLTDDPEALGALLPTLKMLLEADPGGAGAPKSREQLWFLLETLLKNIARVVPLVLFIDDMQWADEGTVALGSHLARNVADARLLLLGALRPEEMIDSEGRERDMGEFTRAAGADAVNILDVAPLSSDETAALVRLAMADPTMSRTLGPFVHKRAQGNPFFTIEMIRLLSAPEAAGDEAARRVDETTRRVLPQTIEEILTRRLARLTREEREILEVGAVEGEVFHADVIAEATGLPRLKLLSRLRDLHRIHQIVEPRAEGYRFAQGMIREVLLKEMPADLRQECHSVVASHFLKGYADRPDYAGPIAAHLYRAERHAEALPYQARAAEEARRLFLYDRALLYLDRAIDSREKCGAPAGDWVRLFIARADVLLQLGRPAEARQAAETALATTLERPDHPDRPEAEEMVGEAALEQGDYDAAERYLSQSFQDFAADESSARGRPRTERKLAALSFRRGEFDVALERYTSARQKLEAAGDRQSLAEVRMEVAQIMVQRGDFEPARVELEAALAEFRALGDPHGECRGLSRLGSLTRQRGQFDEAAARYEEAFDVAARIGDLQGMAVLQANLGNVHLQRDDADKARASYEEALKRFRAVGDQRGAAQVLMALGNACFMQERHAEAADWYRQSLAPRGAMKDRWGLANSLDNLGVAEYRLGRWLEAAEHIGAARKLREEVGDRPGLVESQLNDGALRAALGDHDGARKRLEAALETAAALTDETRTARARLLLALLDFWAGRFDAARSRLDEAASAPPRDRALASRARLIAGLVKARTAPAEAPRLLTEALEIAEAAGLKAEAAQAELSLGRHLLESGLTRDAAARASAALQRTAGIDAPVIELTARRLIRQVASSAIDPDNELRIGQLEERLGRAADSSGLARAIAPFPFP